MKFKPYKFLAYVSRGKYAISRKDTGTDVLKETSFHGRDLRLDVHLGKYLEFDVRIRLPITEIRL